MTQIGESISVPAPPAQGQQAKATCQYCGKAPHPFSSVWGSNRGSSAMLRGRMYSGKTHESHKWWIGGGALQAHHLICSESMADDGWATICRQFGYNINCKENGVMLPNKMALACQVQAPLHRGNHAEGTAGGLPYPNKVKQIILAVKDKAKRGGYCSNPGQLVSDLNDKSEMIFDKVKSFTYTLTKDGKDYQASSSVGCAGLSSLSGKPTTTNCPNSRRHGLKKGAAVVEPAAIAIGK